MKRRSFLKLPAAILALYKGRTAIIGDNRSRFVGGTGGNLFELRSSEGAVLSSVSPIGFLRIHSAPGPTADLSDWQNILVPESDKIYPFSGLSEEWDTLYDIG